MKSTLLAICLFLLVPAVAVAADYRVEVLKEGPPSGEIPADLAAQLDSTGVRVMRGTKTSYCDIWLCKELSVAEDSPSSSAVTYALKPGQLVGVTRYARKGADFRDNDIAPGVYTLRYALQPIDGDHEGTFSTRDFLLIVRAEDEESPDQMEDEDELNLLAADAVESTHPGMFPLLRSSGEAGDAPTMRYNEEDDWWILRLRAQAKAGDKKQELDLEFVLVGVAEE